MTTGAHVDLVRVGTATVQVIGRPFSATGIALPPAGADALVLRVHGPASLGGDATTAVFGERRLLDLEHAEPNDQTTDANSLSLESLSVVAFAGSVGTRIGVTDATEAMPFGELLIGGFNTGGEVTVTLWHMEPADIDSEALSATAAARLLPVPSPETRGFAVHQSEDGETYELVEDDGGGGGSGSDGSAYATVAEYSKALTDRSELTRSDASVELIGLELDAAAAIIDQWCRRSFRTGSEDDARTDVYHAADAHLDIDLQMNPMEALLLPIDDSVSVSEVKMNGQVVAAEKWRAEPSVETTTWTLDQLRLLDNDDYWHGRIEVTRVPGWAAVPPAIKLCNIELAARRRLETPTAFGDSLNAQEVVSGDTRALLFKYLGMYRRELVG